MTIETRQSSINRIEVPQAVGVRIFDEFLQMSDGLGGVDVERECLARCVVVEDRKDGQDVVVAHIFAAFVTEAVGLALSDVVRSCATGFVSNSCVCWRFMRVEMKREKRKMS